MHVKGAKRSDRSNVGRLRFFPVVSLILQVLVPARSFPASILRSLNQKSDG
jgi:hypothetical protein